jgi:hypothetical protein
MRTKCQSAAGIPAQTVAIAFVTESVQKRKPTSVVDESEARLDRAVTWTQDMLTVLFKPHHPPLFSRPLQILASGLIDCSCLRISLYQPGGIFHKQLTALLLCLRVPMVKLGVKEKTFAV